MGLQEMQTLAISKFDIPGDPGFILNSVYGKPGTAQEGGKFYYYSWLIDTFDGVKLRQFILTFSMLFCF